MVYKVEWTPNALSSYERNMSWLQENWTTKEVTHFAQIVQNKISLLSDHPEIGRPRNKRQPNIRQTVLHKKILLIYRVKKQTHEIELLLFWNTPQKPSKLKT